MSEKLSEQLSMIAGALETTNPLRGRRIAHIARKVAALEQQLAAKDAEITRLRSHEYDEDSYRQDCSCGWLCPNREGDRLVYKQWKKHRDAALAETPAAPEVRLGTCNAVLTPHEYAGCLNWTPVAAPEVK